MPRPALRRFGLLVGVVGVAPASALGQTVDPGQSVDVNFAYLHTFGLGGFKTGDQRTRVFRMAPAFAVRQIPEHPWGLKVYISVAVGTGKLDSLEDFQLDNVRLLSVVPGIEILRPVSRVWLAKAFVGVGFGTTFDRSQADLLTSFGVGSELVFPTERFEFGLEPLLAYSFSETIASASPDEAFGTAVLRVDGRYRLGFMIGDVRPDVGLYLVGGYLWNALEFASGAGETVRNSAQYEIGVTFGSAPKIRVWFVALPRVSIGYRTGTEFRGVNIKLGGRETRVATVDALVSR